MEALFTPSAGSAHHTMQEKAPATIETYALLLQILFVTARCPSKLSVRPTGVDGWSKLSGHGSTSVV